MRRALAAAAVAALFLTGCSGSDEPAATEETPAASLPSESTGESGASEEPSESPSEEPTDDSADAVEIEIEGDRVEPNGLRLEVGVGEPVRLAIESDRPAELHVHSTPEQVLDVEQGRSTLTLTIDRPGLVDVEEHDTGRVVLQLEVR